MSFNEILNLSVKYYYKSIKKKDKTLYYSKKFLAIIETFFE